MAEQSQGGASNVDLFDAYFRRADLDRDGRISGAEAVAFFQGSSLPKNVLAQIWTYADHNRTGHLGRAEFYNALRLVTVAQSKRELTPDIVKAALYTPASTKIPAPQINFSTASAPQPNAMGKLAPASQVGPSTPSSQNPAFRAMPPQNLNVSQQYSISQTHQSVRPPQPMPGGNVRPIPSVYSQGFSGPSSQVTSRGINPSAPQAGFGSGLLGLARALPPRLPASSGMMRPASVNTEPKALFSQNGFASDSLLGGDAFSATPSQVKKEASFPTPSLTSVQVSSGLVPVSVGAPLSVKQGSFDSFQNSFTVQPAGGQHQRMQSTPKQQNQQVHVQRPSSRPGLPPPVPSPSQPQQQWPRMTQSDVQKYTKVFVEVDSDKDGKITGEQARNLFLSWRLPREVLRQVWDLSDQDNDSMLSLREFCIALYLMERYREGHPLPSVLPSNIFYNMPATVQPAVGYGLAASGYASGSQQVMLGSGVRHIPRPAGKPPLPAPAAHADEQSNPKQQKMKLPVLEKHLVDQLSEEEQKNLNSKFQDATEANKKVEELEKEIKESREKTEFYRTKMQELVLYKSRCENRLNEITARVSTDKREVEMLAKKYEERYKETGDVASKLTIEESTFRDIQERKMDLYRAIVKLEQDGGNDENLKDRVEKIQYDLEELVRSLNERCKRYGLHGKPTTILELPFGWQPGIQEGVADWDADWDKFEEEGFTFVKELTLDVQNVTTPPKTKTQSTNKEKSSVNESKQATASSDAEARTKKAESVFKEVDDSEAKVEKSGIVDELIAVDSDSKGEKSGSVVEQVVENGSAHEDNEAVPATSPMGSPAARSSHESPQDRFRNNHFDKGGLDSTPQAKEGKSDHGGFDEPAWGFLNNNDDVDSVWGSNAVSTSKDDDLFGPGGVALNPIKTGTSFGDSNFMRKGSSVFADSVPSTPLFPQSYSPQTFNEGPNDYRVPSFSRFDSFRSTESGFQPSGTLARFDSMRSTNDFDYGTGFPSFDDSDPFGSGQFRYSIGTETPRSEVEPFGSSSFRLSLGSETPQSEVDPFVADPFRSTFACETPTRGLDLFGPAPFRSTFASEIPRRDSDSSGPGPFRSSFGSETPRSGYDAFGSIGPFKSSLGSETPRSEWMGGETPRRGEFDSSFGYGGPFKSSLGSETPRADADLFGSFGPFRSSMGDETPSRDLDPYGRSGSFKSSFANETPRGGTNN